MSDVAPGTRVPAPDAWYAFEGPENDVAVSSRVRFARNLANFPFPKNFHGDDARRVQTLVFDSFAQAPDADSYQALAIKALDPLGTKILTERGVMQASALRSPDSGVVMRTDGRLSCIVNDGDHVKIIAFATGLACDEAFNLCRLMDSNLQQSLQFAASYDFGFLTSSLRDCGSGMHVAVRVHLPSLSFEKQIPAFAQDLAKSGIDMGATFGAGSESGTSLGCYYQIATRYARAGSELDQMAGIVSAVESLAKAERKSRNQLRKSRRTELLDGIYRSFSRAKFSLLMPLREAIDIIAGIKWGKDLGFISGVDYGTLCALLYRIQDGHLQFLLKNGSFTFSKDIASNPQLQIQRIRALILQEAFEHIAVGDNE